jgi:hypothetical protein
MAEALTLAKGQPVERAVAMLLRTAVMLEIAAERKGWPDRIAGLPDRTRSPRAAPALSSAEIASWLARANSRLAGCADAAQSGGGGGVRVGQATNGDPQG